MKTKKQIQAELDKLGVEYQKSWNKDRLEQLLAQSRRPDRIRDASRQKGV